MPEIQMPDGTVKRFGYDAKSMEDYRRTMAALELQKQQAGMNTQQMTPSMQLQQQPQQAQMGYMGGIQGQPGAPPAPQGDQTAWNFTYDVKNDPNIQAGMRYIQSQQLGAVYDPIREQRQMGPPPPRQMFQQGPVEAPPMQVAEGSPGAYGTGPYGEARRRQETQPYQGPMSPQMIRSKQGRERLETPVDPMQRAAYQLFRG